MAYEEGSSADLALEMLQTLTDGVDFTMPDVSFEGPGFELPSSDALTSAVVPLTNDDLTTKVIDGTGTFDVLMTTITAHLRKEYDANRITGAEYTKAYIAAIQIAVQGGVQFLLGRDAASWAGINAQIAAINGNVAIQTAKITAYTAQLQAETAKSAYGLTTAKIATEDAQYASSQSQATHIQAQTGMVPFQTTLIKEQTEAARAQTTDTRTDGTTILGSVGKQKSLYDQQITSYKRDAEFKFAKMYTDAFVTQYTVNEEGIPNEFSQTQINSLLVDLRGKNGIVP